MAWLRAARTAPLVRSRVGRLGVWGWRAAAFSAALASAAPARADEPPLVMLELERCDDLDETEVRRIVSAELGARPANIGGQDVTQVTVSCDTTHITIHVTDPLSRKSVQRAFDIGLSDPRARPRLVAIAATELVLASWTELETNPRLHVEPVGPAPSPGVAKAARAIAKERMVAYVPKPRRWYDLETPPDRQLRFVALGSARAFFNYEGKLYGGGVRIGEERFRWVSWSADVLVESGSILDATNAPEPPVTYQVTTGTVGGAVFAYLRSPNVTGRLGVGLRAGLAGSTASPATKAGTSSVAPWGWPLGAASVTLRGENFGLELSGEAGYVVLPVREDGRALSGAWLSAQIGLAFLPEPTSKAAPEAPEGEAGE